MGYREQQKRRLNKQQSVDGAFAQQKETKRAVFSVTGGF